MRRALRRKASASRLNREGISDDRTSRARLPLRHRRRHAPGVFLFAALVLVAYRGFADRADAGADPYTKKGDVDARNRAVIDGKEPGVKPMAQRCRSTRPR